MTTQQEQRFREAINRMGGKKEILVAVAAMALQDAPVLIKEVDESLAAGRLSEATAPAHSLKGLLATFESGSPIAELQQVENATHAGDSETAMSAWETARPSIDILLTEIAALDSA